MATTSKTSPLVSISENQSNQNRNNKIILAENFPHMVIQHRENESKYLSLFFMCIVGFQFSKVSLNILSNSL